MNHAPKARRWVVGLLALALFGYGMAKAGQRYAYRHLVIHINVPSTEAQQQAAAQEVVRLVALYETARLDTITAPSLRQARQRAAYQVARIQNALEQDSIALYHANRLYNMLDSMVVADSLRNEAPYDSVVVASLHATHSEAVAGTWAWADLHISADTMAVGDTIQMCAYMLVSGTIVAKTDTFCPDPPSTYTQAAPLLVDRTAPWKRLLGGAAGD